MHQIVVTLIFEACLGTVEKAFRKEASLDD